MKNGFTIIELVISIFVLSIAVVGIFTAFSIMVILTSDATDRLTAAYLAQEGMEIVRNIRDTNWLNISNGFPEAKWIDGLTDASTNNYVNCRNGCEADYTAANSGAMHAYSGAFLKINPNGFYYYDPTASSETKFKRKITITCLPTGDCSTDYIMMVSVQVTWKKKATILNSSISADFCNSEPGFLPNNNCVEAEETLYNWYRYN